MTDVAGATQQDASSAEPPRTAVLVVHGMGIQRPMQTVRGVFNSLMPKLNWNDPRQSTVRFERTTTDPDLPVIAAVIPETGKKVNFHELYWSHLMSETRAIAVLLWIFELVRRGPNLRPGMNFIWIAVATFMALLLLSASLVILKLMLLLASLSEVPQALFLTPVLMTLAVLFLITCVCFRYRKYRPFKSATWIVKNHFFEVNLGMGAAFLLALGLYFPWTSAITGGLVPVFVFAAVAARVLMGEFWAEPIGWAFLFSLIMYLIVLVWAVPFSPYTVATFF